MYAIMDNIFGDEAFVQRLKKQIDGKKVVVYGMTTVGKALASRLKNEDLLAYCMDRKMDGVEYMGVPIYGINHFEDMDKDVAVVIALHWSEDVIKRMLERAGYQNPILRVRDLTGVK